MPVVTKVIKIGVSKKVTRPINHVADVTLAINTPKDNGLKGDSMKKRGQHLLLPAVSYERNPNLPNRLAANFQSYSISVLHGTTDQQ